MAPWWDAGVDWLAGSWLGGCTAGSADRAAQLLLAPKLSLTQPAHQTSQGTSFALRGTLIQGRARWLLGWVALQASHARVAPLATLARQHTCYYPQGWHHDQLDHKPSHSPSLTPQGGGADRVWMPGVDAWPTQPWPTGAVFIRQDASCCHHWPRLTPKHGGPQMPPLMCIHTMLCSAP